MGKRTWQIAFLVCLAIMVWTKPGVGAEISWGGYLNTEISLELDDEYWITQEGSRLVLSGEAGLGGTSRIYFEGWVEGTGLARVGNSYNLRTDVLFPQRLTIREAYVDMYSFLWDNIDVRLGRQRISWGSADKFNPTDNLNPDDLENVWDFGRRYASDAVKVTYYGDEFTLQGVYMPFFVPATLPPESLFPRDELQGIAVGNFTDTLVLPEERLSQTSTIGLKVAKNIADYDVSLSYVYGREYLPLPEHIEVTGAPPEVDVHGQFIYPRRHILGADMAGSIKDVGVWAEVAVFFPEKVVLTQDLSSLGMGVHESIYQEDRAYVKYVAGADYTFKDGTYINGQYVHGFPQERDCEGLGDYFVFAVEKELPDRKMKVTPLAGAIEVRDFKDISGSYAMVLTPELAYYPIDNTEMILGLRWIDGKEGTLFGQMKDAKEVYLKFKYSF
jgi:hypothetical protein